MKILHAFLTLSQLVLGENARLFYNKVAELSADIERNGLTDHLKVEAGDNHGRIIRGYRRRLALIEFDRRNPTGFKKMFPKGIPVDVCEGTVAEIACLKVDQGNIEGLTSPVETQRAANILFRAGLTEGDVAIRLGGLLDSQNPVRGNVKKEIDDLRVAGHHTEADARYKDYRRGLVQSLKLIYQCPDVVMSVLEYQVTGELPDGFEDEKDIPKLTTANCKSLKKAYAEDMADVDSNDIPKYGKANPGPIFQSAFQKLVAKTQAKASGTEEKKVKPWGAKKIREYVAEVNSRGLRAILLMVSGEEGKMAEVAAADRKLVAFENVESNEPSEAARITEIHQELLKAQKAEANAQAKQVADQQK